MPVQDSAAAFSHCPLDGGSRCSTGNSFVSSLSDDYENPFQLTLGIEDN